MRILVTGGTGALGRATLPILIAAGHDVFAPGHRELDLFDRDEIVDALGASTDAVLHLATRIPSLGELENPDAWRDNDRLRTDSARLLVDTALRGATQSYVQPTVALFYPKDEPTDEDTPLGEVPAPMRSALVAEAETARFAAAGRRGVALRLGLLDGPGTGHDEPNRAFGASLYVGDAAAALVAALTVPSGIYNVTREGERVSSARFQAAACWRPMH